ncbi:hypothetical protein [Vibrio barjaei]|uniref:hypothetical protein n=1 Tax=Vibrio barjaei TaxID=1676683 RepID=UPI0007BC2C5D|nr:hypothetical protein [Vibrio barjaei]OIN23730.1 hypothetical protein AWH66_2020410 [Vibrio barjaei]
MKTPNPVRGYVDCPVCQSAATVHMVGEGRMIDTGEPPKNSRNLGKLYYRCPECGNSSVSNKVNEYCVDHMRDTSEKPQALPDKVETLDSTVELTVEPTVEPTVELTVEPTVDEVVESTDSTEMITVDPTPITEPTEETVTPPKPSLKPQLLKVGACLGLILVLLFAIKRLLATPQPTQEGDANE